MKTMRRLLAVLMVLVLLCVGVPVAAQALDTTGSCGENVTWSFNSSTGALTISGSGAMKNYSYSSSPFYNKTEIKSVTINNGVTSIGSDAFEYCTSLTSVTIPDSVTSIGGIAFYGCTSLTSVTIPDSVTSIGVGIFACCSKLQSIVVSASNQTYSSANGILYNKDKSTLIQCPGAKTEVMIPNSVTSIGEYAFYACSSLTNVTIPNSVTSIGEHAFYACSSLTSVTIPNSVMSIGRGAFSSCTALTSVTIPDSVTSIGAGVFGYCSKLQSILVSASNQNYSSANGILYNKNKTTLIQCPGAKTEVAIPNSVTSIGRPAFSGCTSLTSVMIPDSVTIIGDEAFYNCTKLKDVYYTGSEADWNAITIGYNNTPLANATIHYNYQHEHTVGTPVRENEVPATCTSAASYEAVTNCTLCGEEMSRETVYEGNPLGHAPQTYTTPSTCAENGFTITICTRCGETLSKETLPRLDHNWTSEVTQNPTCTAQGVKTYTCESCGETYTEPVDVLAHEWDDGKMTKAPSCTEAGEMTYTCATGGETRTEPIDKLDHEIVLVKGKEATCTDPGLTDGWQCKMCKKWFAEQQTIPALDHDPQIGKVVEPTCEEPGYTPFICTRCGETVSKTDPTDALGHDMQPTYVWAKDDSTVTATMVCTRCDKTGMTETAEVKTEITVKPTCSTEGELTLIAAFNNKSFYGQVKTKTLPRDPDAHVFKVTVTPPTCIDDGYTTHACTLCRYGYSDGIVPANGHTPVTDEAVPATCEQTGLTEGAHCSVCGEVLTAQEETPALDHADADNDGLCDTCEQQMTGGDHCKYCGKVHDGVFGWLISFFHSILAIFKR